MRDPGTRPGPACAWIACAAAALFIFILSARESAAQTAQSNQKVPLTLGFEIRAWLPSIFNGMLKINHADHDGTEIGFRRDLDMHATPEILEIGFHIGQVQYGKILFTWCNYSVYGNKVLVRDLWYNGAIFNGPSGGGFGETVHTEMDFSFHRLTIQTMQNFAGSYFIGLDIGIVMFDFKGEMTKRTFMTPESAAMPSRSAHAEATLPYTGLFAEFDLGEYFKLTVGLAGVFFQATKTDVRLTEFYVRLDFFLAEVVVIGLGYRYQNIDATIDQSGTDDGALEMELQGVVLALGIKF